MPVEICVNLLNFLLYCFDFVLHVGISTYLYKCIYIHLYMYSCLYFLCFEMLKCFCLLLFASLFVLFKSFAEFDTIIDATTLFKLLFPYNSSCLNRINVMTSYSNAIFILSFTQTLLISNT